MIDWIHHDSQTYIPTKNKNTGTLIQELIELRKQEDLILQELDSRYYHVNNFAKRKIKNLKKEKRN
jgi:hypothetical protein